MKVIERFLRKALQQRLLEDPTFAQRLRERARDDAVEPDAGTVEVTRQATENVLNQALGASTDAGGRPDALRQLLRDRATEGDK